MFLMLHCENSAVSMLSEVEDGTCARCSGRWGQAKLVKFAAYAWARPLSAGHLGTY